MAVWENRVDKKIEALQKIGIYKVVPIPKRRKIIVSKTVYKTKQLTDNIQEKYKERRVAQNFFEMSVIDFSEGEIFLPIVAYELLPFMLVLAA